jgi:hypothetical protein
MSVGYRIFFRNFTDDGRGYFPLPVVIRSSRVCGKFDGDPKGADSMTANYVTAVMGPSMPLMSLDTSFLPFRYGTAG